MESNVEFCTTTVPIKKTKVIIEIMDTGIHDQRNRWKCFKNLSQPFQGKNQKEDHDNWNENIMKLMEKKL